MIAETPFLFLSPTQVGLDAAGKTTILYKLKLGEIVTTIPTIGKPPPHDDSSPASSEALEIRRPNLPRPNVTRFEATLWSHGCR